MKIVIISEGTPREKVVISSIVRNFEEIILIKQVEQPRNISLKQTLPKKSKKQNNTLRFLNNFGNRKYFKYHKILLEKNLREFNLKDFDIKTIELTLDELKNEIGIQLLNSLSPDIIFTCRAPILRPEVLNIPRFGSINVHFGIAPKYRGNNTLFWALMNKDSKNIGACIHYINNGVDRGNILAKAYPALTRNESEVSIDLKTLALVAEAAVTVLKKIEKDGKQPIGLVQNELGRNYKHSERTFFLNLKYLFKKSLGLIQTEPREQSLIYYLDE